MTRRAAEIGSQGRAIGVFAASHVAHSAARIAAAAVTSGGPEKLAAARLLGAWLAAHPARAGEATGAGVRALPQKVGLTVTSRSGFVVATGAQPAERQNTEPSPTRKFRNCAASHQKSSSSRSS